MVVFAVVVALSLRRHSLWFDETQAWNIARASRSLGDLWHNTRYEGHPVGWHLLLFVVTRVSTDVRAMQVLNGALATGAAAVVLWRAPWRLPVRIAICASYFFVFEYAALSRSYTLAVFAWVLALAAPRGSWWRVTAIVVLCTSSALGIILGVALVATDALPPPAVSRRKLVATTAAVSAAAVLAALSLIPPADSRSGTGFGTRLADDLPVRLAASFSALLDGVLPAPELPVSWNHTAWRALPLSARAILGLALAMGICVLLRRSRRGLTLWIVGASCLLLFSTVVYDLVSLRHAGHYSLLLLGAGWVTVSDDATAPNLWTRELRLVLSAALAVAVVAGTTTVITFLGRDFNDFRDTAERIRRLGPVDVVSIDDLRATVIGAYLRSTVWSAAERRDVHFVRYDDSTLRSMGDRGAMVSAARAHIRCLRGPAVLVGDPVHPELLAAVSSNGTALGGAVVLVSGEDVCQSTSERAPTRPVPHPRSGDHQ